MTPQAINDFIVKNNLDAQDFERKFNRQDLAVAIVGYLDNQYSLNLIAHLPADLDTINYIRHYYHFLFLNCLSFYFDLNVLVHIG